MEFHGRFVCSSCQKEFTIDLGPQKMAELKTPKKIGEQLGELSKMFARSCLEHEKEHAEEPKGEPQKPRADPSDNGCRCPCAMCALANESPFGGNHCHVTTRGCV